MIRFAIAAGVLAFAIQPASAQEQHRRVQISPYIEAGQVLAADLGDGGDVLTYSTLGAGIDASVQTRRV